jgi:hypothetical protein
VVTTAQASQRAGPKQSKSAFKRWLLEGSVKEIEGPFEREKEHYRHHAWYKVMCLTGVDYFSTLGYQPGIAFLAAVRPGASGNNNPGSADVVGRTPNLSSSRGRKSPW